MSKYTCIVFQVETADHARLRIKVAFNNHFEVSTQINSLVQTAGNS